MKFEVNGQSLKLVEGATVAEGAVEFASFSIFCDSSWDGYSRCVRFRHAGDEDIWDVAGVQDGKVYYIPAEVLIRGSVFVSVLGVKGNERISTTELAGFFVEGSLDNGKTPQVTPDAYAQYVSAVTESVAETRESRDRALLAMRVCEGLAGDMTVVQDGVLESEKNCQNYAALCERSYSAVSGAEVSMQSAVESVRESAQRLLNKDSELSQAENVRKTNEENRIKSEKARKDAEKERTVAEENRELFEAGRVAAEKARVISDKEREARLSSVEEKTALAVQSLLKKASAVKGFCDGKTVLVDDAAGDMPFSLCVRGESNVVGEVSKDTPCEITSVGEEGKITLTHQGKNLFAIHTSLKTPITNDGITFTPMDDGGVAVFGTSTLDRSISVSSSKFTLPAGEYTLSGGMAKHGVRIIDAETSSVLFYSLASPTTFTLEEAREVKVQIYLLKSNTATNSVVYPLLRFTGTNSDFVRDFINTASVKIEKSLHGFSGIDGKVYDEIVFFDKVGGARIIRRCALETLDGEENIQFVESDGTFNVFALTSDKFTRAKKLLEYRFENMGVCNAFPFNDKGEEECVWMSEDKVYMKLLASEFPDTIDVKNFLSEKYINSCPVKIVHALEEETVEMLTLDFEPVLEQGVNLVFASDGKTVLEYTKDTTLLFETIIDSLLQLDARVSLLEV